MCNRDIDRYISWGRPPLAASIFKNLSDAGLSNACIFGGAQRDSDYAALWGRPITIKDYDIRVWSTESDNVVLAKLATLFGPYKVVPAAGTPHMRYLFTWQGAELDVSIRWPKDMTPAIDRVADSDAGLSAVAIDSDLCCWCRNDYQSDIRNKTITTKDTSERALTYAARLQSKFPDHRLIK